MSTDQRRLYVVAYDVPDDRRRTKIANALEGYGDRLQYSVFLVSSSPAKLVWLKDTLAGLVMAKEDSIALFDLGVHAEKRLKRVVTFIGVMREISPADVIIL